MKGSRRMKREKSSEDQRSMEKWKVVGGGG